MTIFLKKFFKKYYSYFTCVCKKKKKKYNESKKVFFFLFSDNNTKFDAENCRFTVKKRKLFAIDDDEDEDDIVELESVFPASKSSKFLNSIILFLFPWKSKIYLYIYLKE